jgi:hypothetical protein
LVACHVHSAHELTSVIEVIDQKNRRASDCAEVAHPIVLPEKGMLSWNSGGGVHGRICQRPPRHLPTFVDHSGRRVRTTQCAQIPYNSVLPQKGPALLRNAKAETKRVGYGIRGTSDHLAAVIYASSSALISSQRSEIDGCAVLEKHGPKLWIPCEWINFPVL